jgi:hypothetical protein
MYYFPVPRPQRHTEKYDLRIQENTCPPAQITRCKVNYFRVDKRKYCSRERDEKSELEKMLIDKTKKIILLWSKEQNKVGKKRS